MSDRDSMRLWLVRSWWLLMPLFACLVLRLVFERTCASPYELLPSVTSVPLLAWALAGVYLASHVWVAAACVFTIERTDTLVPTIAGIRQAWRGDILKLMLASAVFALEYAPIPFWQAIGHHVLHCAR